MRHAHQGRANEKAERDEATDLEPCRSDLRIKHPGHLSFTSESDLTSRSACPMFLLVFPVAG